MAENEQRTPKVLVVDDDPRLRDLLRRYLGENGFSVSVAENGQAMNRIWLRERFDALILDLMMPGEDGLQILRRLRAGKDMTPVIMLTARGEDVDRIVGLELGADDYIPKPFKPRELISRIKNALRRCGNRNLLEVGNLEINADSGTVTKNGAELALSALEYRLLLLLVSNRGRLMTREKLLEDIWDVAGDFVNDNTLTVYIKRIREKVEDDPANPTVIRTVRGLGYRVD